jgi:hypothetical protein
MTDLRFHAHLRGCSVCAASRNLCAVGALLLKADVDLILQTPARTSWKARLLGLLRGLRTRTSEAPYG